MTTEKMNELQEKLLEEKLQKSAEYLKEYAAQLKVTDWHIELVLEMFSDCGKVDYDINTKTATILINQAMPWDEIQHTIRHELFHLVLAPIATFVQCFIEDEKAIALYQSEEERLVARLSEVAV